MDNSARRPNPHPATSEVAATSRIIDTPFIPGEKIAGRYVVERAIAEGGMGIVVAARHLELDETVAIKFLKPEFARQPEIIGRFAREAKAVLRVKCEYVATVFDVGVTPDRGPYIVMEYLKGENLETVLATEGRLSPDRCVEIILQACEALATAHANGIVHRDIKPANLFIVNREPGAPPVTKVLDFGVSKAALAGTTFGNAMSLVKSQSVLGTPLYMSPEQLRGTEVDARSDVWSIGALLYEMLTGRLPFEGASITEVTAAVLESEPREIKELAPMVGPGIAAVVMTCLQKKPEDRYRTVAELAVALAPFGPKRARLCVERAVAVSKSGGLIAGGYTLPASLHPSSHPARPSGAPAADATADFRPPIESVDEIPPPKRSQLGRSLVLAALFAVLAAAIIFVKDLTGQKAEATPTPTAPTNATAEATPEAPATAPAPTGDIQLLIQARPAEAKLFLDDALLPANPFRRTVPRDGRAHAVRIEAAGYVTRSIAVTYDADVEINVTLEKGHGRAPTVVHAPSRSENTGRSAPAVAAAATAAQPAAATAATGAPPAPATTASATKPGVHEVELPKSSKPVRGLDTGSMW